MSPNQALVVVAEQLVEVAQGLFGGGAPGLRACPVLAVQLREAARDGVLDSSRLVGAGACGQFPHQRHGALALDIEAHGRRLPASG
ncbi:Uncharacterised protein [Mycobacterium tuberculosis]|uniref:Uncharacterized protein n=1 Tax=Mycobacterium tuberculosis TaxID=1773 RepID=A0A654U1V1_MYCTX|nr:Uncharacterised protein [Mycobacterium tuberculosis]